MEDEIQDIFKYVNNLAECQRHVIERVNFLEDKRHEILKRIINLEVSSRTNLIIEIKQINQMEIAIARNVNVTINGENDDRVNKVTKLSFKKSNKKCR